MYRGNGLRKNKKPANRVFRRAGFWRKLVGLRGFEPPTLCTPCKCASQTALQPEKGNSILLFRACVVNSILRANHGKCGGFLRSREAKTDLSGNAFFHEKILISQRLHSGSAFSARGDEGKSKRSRDKTECRRFRN